MDEDGRKILVDVYRCRYCRMYRDVKVVSHKDSVLMNHDHEPRPNPNPFIAHIPAGNIIATPTYTTGNDWDWMDFGTTTTWQVNTEAAIEDDLQAFIQGFHDDAPTAGDD
jgi:hypothetical protein